jgi:excisionase family DNA binding protein
MPRTRINPNRVKIHFNYSVEEAARTLGVHKNTVREWLRNGLPKIDDRWPVLILGRELRAYLKARRQSGKRPCEPGTLYCFSCRAPRRPAMQFVQYTPYTETSGNLSAFCERCETVMNRRARASSIAAVMPGLEIQFVRPELRLRGRDAPSLNSDSEQEGSAHGAAQRR